MIETYKDILMTVRYECAGHFVTFDAFLIVGFEGTEDDATPLYESGGKCGIEDATVYIANSQPAIQGTIKWDGCCHLNFGDEGYVHLCGKLALRNLQAALEKVYFRAGELMKASGETETLNDEFDPTS